jgi:hypothetical protein
VSAAANAHEACKQVEARQPELHKLLCATADPCPRLFAIEPALCSCSQG